MPCIKSFVWVLLSVRVRLLSRCVRTERPARERCYLAYLLHCLRCYSRSLTLRTGPVMRDQLNETVTDESTTADRYRGMDLKIYLCCTKVLVHLQHSIESAWSNIQIHTHTQEAKGRRELWLRQRVVNAACHYVLVLMFTCKSTSRAYIFFSLFFCSLISEFVWSNVTKQVLLATRSSMIQSYKLRSEIVSPLQPPSPLLKKWRPKSIKVSTIWRLDIDYLRNTTRNRQTESRVATCDHSRICTPGELWFTDGENRQELRPT